MSGDDKKKRAALKISIKEGCAANAATGFGDQYITPAILAVQGNAGHVGFVNALIGIAGPLAQLFGNKLEKKYSDKKIVVKSTMLQALLWVVLAIVPLIYMFLGNTLSIYSIIFIYTLIFIIGGVLHPAFFSWMGLLVNKNERGKYFSKRSAIIGAVNLVVIILAALLLDVFKDINKVLLGFTVLFLLAALFRTISYNYLKTQYAPSTNKSKIIELPWKMFISMKSRIGRFTIGMSAFNFAIMIASPFFAVYLLQERGYSYFVYTMIIMGSAAWSLIFYPLIGKFSDRYGNASLLNLSGFLFTITPPMWIFIQSPILLILVPQLLNGIANAALAIGVGNYVYANISEDKRGTTIAHVNVLAGVGVLVGSLLGGILLSTLKSVPNIFFIVFLIAAIFRGIVSIAFLSRLRDVKSSHSKLLNFDIIHPIKSIYHDSRMIKNLLEK